METMEDWSRWRGRQVPRCRQAFPPPGKRAAPAELPGTLESQGLWGGSLRALSFRSRGPRRDQPSKVTKSWNQRRKPRAYERGAVREHLPFVPQEGRVFSHPRRL
ncbi:hypothetical protein H8959_010059 [Pygathrix nigripes]